MVLLDYLSSWSELGEEGLPFKFRETMCHYLPVKQFPSSCWTTYDMSSLILDITIWIGALIILYLISCLIILFINKISMKKKQI